MHWKVRVFPGYFVAVVAGYRQPIRQWRPAPLSSEFLAMG
jgi:hypothetical protein